ncbi:DUF1360 domain-containing protein [Paenibacillus sp. ACRRX]|uniref:DUF1360 domain-containing protein n=1 Tax=unclassified Paenibacillus TaxID=185978 RepID=UPI001EF719BD|nr:MULTISPECIES: DUF1360 domain-containing protein [unclassified Paenibacillus]MCG7410382.1 DUF1360 domain-containing protein [Paenibacillus sp. ACRRX]MDK8181211.1 DUF1360 domain-containing protein [Paenibacillus sp. UMB4589-SE434]
MWSLNVMTFIILFLASYRLTRLIVFDEITSFIRKPFLEEKIIKDEKGALMAVIEGKGSKFHTFMRKLLTCYWCTGIWAAAVIVSIYLFLPNLVAVPILLILAVAGAAGIMESFVKG